MFCVESVFLAMKILKSELNQTVQLAEPEPWADTVYDFVIWAILSNLRCSCFRISIVFCLWFDILYWICALINVLQTEPKLNHEPTLSRVVYLRDSVTVLSWFKLFKEVKTWAGGFIRFLNAGFWDMFDL